MTAKINSAYRQEFVLLKLQKPTRRKRQWLTEMAACYRDAIQHTLQVAQAAQIQSRGQLHAACYHEIRRQFGFSSDQARLAINKARMMLNSYHAMQRSKIVQKTSFPKARGHQGIGVGRDSYRLFTRENGIVLRLSTQKPRQFLWFPLHVPDRYQQAVGYAYGDAELFLRNQEWYISLPLRFPAINQSQGNNPTVIGIDLGLVRLATVVTPESVVVFDGRPILRKRAKHVRLRQRYWRKGRNDRIKASGRKEQRWVRNINHQISYQIVDLADQYPHAVIALENLDGIAHKVKGVKSLRKMVGTWAFKQLSDMIVYKAARIGIDVVFVDPRNTSKTCHRCGHCTPNNRVSQHLFRCQNCGLETNADRNAAHNIAAAGLRAWQQGRLGTARLDEDRTGDIGFRPDEVKASDDSLANLNLASSL